MTTASDMIQNTGGIGPRDEMDRFAHFCHEMPKNCLKTIKFTIEWASAFFKDLQNIPQLTASLSALHQGIKIFVIGELVHDLNDARLKVTDWIKGCDNTNLATLVVPLGEAVGRVSEFGKWMFDVGIISLSATVASRLFLVSGVSLMLGFGIRIIKTTNDLQTCDEKYRTLHQWNLAKYIALYALGFFISLAALTNILNPAVMLTCSTVSLVATYATYILEHPIPS